MKSIVRLFVAAVFVCVIVLGCAGVCGYQGLQVSNGFRYGTVQKATDKGIIWQTHEIEAVTEGHKEMTNVWEASVYSDEVWEAIRQIPVDARVKFEYQQHRHVWPWQGETAYEVKSVSVVGGADETEGESGGV